MKTCDKGGRGYEPKSDVTPSIKYYLKNRIRLTKSCMTPLHLLSNVAFHVDNTFCVENMFISAFYYFKIYVKGRLIFSSKFESFWGATRQRGSKI